MIARMSADKINTATIGGRIEHRAAKVSLVNGLSTILSLAFQLVSVPVCLKYWGKESYGSWLALLSAFMMLRSLDGGFVAYVGNKLNYLYHQNSDALRAHLASAVAGIAVISCLQLLLAGGTLIFDPVAATLGIPPDHRAGFAAKLGLPVLTLSWVLTGSYLGIVHRLLIPAGMMYQATWWAMAFQVAQFIAIMAAAVLGLNMLQTSLLFAIDQILIYVASALYVRRVLPGFYPWLQGAAIRTGLADLGHSLTLTGSNMIQQGATNGVVLIISALAGPVTVPMFTTVRTLANLGTAVTTMLTAPLLPDVVRIYAEGEVQKLAAINSVFWVLVGSAVNWGALLLYPLIPFFYGQWTAHAVSLDTPLLCLMLSAVIVTNSGALIALHLNGINSLRIVLATSLARAVLGLGGGALGFRVLGLSSFGLGILAGELAATLISGRYFIKHELADKGFHLPATTYGPITLSTGSALVFFVGSGFGWWSGGWPWCVALVGLATASIWGWRTLNHEMRTRLTGLAMSWSPRS
ncbi:MAG: lipopolysaccharide biosynthesis protein [Steroidobacteraceae bacterium]